LITADNLAERALGAENPDTLNTAGNLAATPVGQGSVDDIQGGSITTTCLPAQPGIGIASPPLQNPLQREQNRATIARRKASAVGQKESKVEEEEEEGGGQGE